MSRKSPAVLLLLTLVVVALLHGSGLLGGRERLPIDGPVILANTRLPVDDVRTTARSLRDAFVDPAAAWDSVAGDVGRTRYRPLSTALLVIQRAIFGGAAATGIALVGLLLHGLLAWLAGALASRLAPDDRASAFVRWATTAIVAVSPLAVPVASWPAHQAGVFAALFATTGALLALRPGKGALVGAGVLLAAAAASHEMAFAWVVAALLLRRAAGARTDRGAVVALSAPVLLFFVVWAWVRVASAPAGPDVDTSAQGGGFDALLIALADGLLGAVVTGIDALLPTRLRFADGPWNGGLLGRLAGAAVFFVALRAAIARRSTPGGALALAAIVPLTGVVVACWLGGAPSHAVYGYVVLPALAGAVAWCLARSCSPAGNAALLMLVIAGAAATAIRAPSFGDRAGFVELAQHDGDGSMVARSWDLAQRLLGLPADGAERRRLLTELRPQVDGIVRSAIGDDALEEGDILQVVPPAEGSDGLATLRLLGRADAARDEVAAAQIGEPLLFFAQTVRASGFPPHARDIEEAAAATEAAVALLPLSARAWTTLAAVRHASGDLSGSLDAATKAFLLDRTSEDAARILARAYIELGSATFAVDLLEEFREGALDRGDSLSPTFDLLLARAYSGDGRRSVLRDGRVYHGFEIAVELAERHVADPRYRRGILQILHDTYLLYGDYLVAEDAPFLALRAYERCVEVFPTVDGRRHLKWLKDRLELEELDARTRVEAARSGDGSLGDALVAHAAALCRLGRFEQADAIFERLTRGQREPSAVLLYLIARHRYAWSPRPVDQQEARRLLESALAADADLHPARLELAKVEERSARFDAALDLYQQVARQAFDRPEGVEAVRHAERLRAMLSR